MDLTPYIANLREDLAATASAGDDHTRRAAALLSGALEPAVRLTLMNALADLAAEVTAGLPGQVVEVRLEGRDVRVVVTGSPGSHGQSPPPRPAPPPKPDPPVPPVDTGDISRITLRLFDRVKGEAEQAAAAQGISLNSFVAQAVQGALRDALHGKGRQHREEFGERGGADRGQGGEFRLHGWVQG